MALGPSFRQSTVGGLSACLSCGSALPLDADVCPACGKAIAQLKNLNTIGSRVGPRTDMPLNASTTDSHADQSQTPPEMPKFLPERYEPVKLLGQGGMGAVYHCIDKQLDRPVAIKVMTDKFRSSPQGETRFMREARAQAIVNHTNVSTILNFGVSPEGKLFLVMEYLEGEDLRDFLRKRGKLDPLLACELMRQAFEGLQEAHACGLVHRDLKPSNVMIIKDHRGQPWVKILDLGLAKMVGGQTDLLTITMDTANQLIGTPAYMSPEQVAGSKVDSRADLYSMGVVFYEMLAGRLPFESESLPGWLFQHLHEKAEVPSRYNPALAKHPEIERLPMWLLEKKPEDRPQTAGEIAAMLKNILAGKSIADLVPNTLRSEMPPEPARTSAAGSSGAAGAVQAGSNPYQPGAGSSAARPAVKFSSIPSADRSRPRRASPECRGAPLAADPSAAARCPRACRRRRPRPSDSPASCVRCGIGRDRADAFFSQLGSAAGASAGAGVECPHESRLVHLGPRSRAGAPKLRPCVCRQPERRGRGQLEARAQELAAHAGSRGHVFVRSDHPASRPLQAPGRI